MIKYKLLKWLMLLVGLPLALCYSLQFYTYIRPPGVFPLDLQWQENLGYSTYERPAYQDGLVLVPANGLFSSSWYGLKADTGKVIWSHRLKRYSFRRCLSSKHLIVSGPQSLAALDPQRGNLLWQGKRAKAATCSKDAVFFVGTRGNIFASNISTGQRRWSGTKPGESVLGVGFNFETNELIGGGAAIIDPASGNVLRVFEPSFVGYPPTDNQYRGRMYLIDRNQLFVGGKVRNATTGEVIADIGRIGNTPPVIVDDK
ncbi:MAG: PQQ-binding-like beta-propeller repeat protein, partial [Deltaproteobacteria bacterium]|nr:PQQ-binding-like beta-propeller repeat protein [Deltaproteobacteria bacterium]